MGRDVLVPLLVSLVLADVVEVVTADDNGAVHLGGDDGTGENLAADRDKTSEGALLVWRKTVSTSPSYRTTLYPPIFYNILLSRQLPSPLKSSSPPLHLLHLIQPHTRIAKGEPTNVGTINSGLGRLKAQPNVLVPSLAPPLLCRRVLAGVEDVRLLLESALALDGKLSGHCELSALVDGIRATGGICRLGMGDSSFLVVADYRWASFVDFC